MWGALWAPSTITGTLWAWAMLTICSTGLTVPSTLLTWQMLTMRVRGVKRRSYSSRSSSPRSLMGITLTTMPRLRAWSCQGTMLEWCSMTETMTSSPSVMQASAKDDATRLRPSVVPRVKTISEVERALMKRRTVSRAASWSSVACWESQCTPRCTLELTLRYSSRMASRTHSGFWVVAPLSRYIRGLS